MKGKIDIPNLSEEHEDMEDVDVDVTLTSKGPEADLLKEMLRKGSGAKRLRETLAAYVTALKTEYSTGLILPKKGENGAAVSSTTSSQPREVVTIEVTLLKSVFRSRLFLMRFRLVLLGKKKRKAWFLY